MRNEMTFETELLLDCDNGKIRYLNERMKRGQDMNVDIKMSFSLAITVSSTQLRRFCSSGIFKRIALNISHLINC